MISASGRLDWWHETRDKLELIGKLCIQHKKAAKFDKNGLVTIYPDDVTLQNVDKALEYLEPGKR